MFYQMPRKLPLKNNIGAHEKYENTDDYDNDLKEWKKILYQKKENIKAERSEKNYIEKVKPFTIAKEININTNIKKVLSMMNGFWIILI